MVSEIRRIRKTKSCQRSEEFGMRPLSQWQGPTISVAGHYLSGHRPTISVANKGIYLSAKIKKQIIFQRKTQAQPHWDNLCSLHGTFQCSVRILWLKQFRRVRTKRWKMHIDQVNNNLHWWPSSSPSGSRCQKKTMYVCMYESMYVCM